MRASTHKAQKDFDQKWISAGELRQVLKVSTATLCLAIKRGTFPKPDVRIRGGLGLWDRDATQAAIAKWKERLGRFRGRQAKILTPSNNPPWSGLTAQELNNNMAELSSAMRRASIP